MRLRPGLIIRDENAKWHPEFHGLFSNGNKLQPRLYRIWRGMRCRCNTVNYNAYKDYGGRGIRVCQEWDTYTLFAAWALANGYEDNLSIDRKDVNGNYTPENCKWSTSKEQSRNKRNSCLVEINGTIQTVSEWSRVTGIHINTLFRRYHKGIRGENLIKK